MRAFLSSERIRLRAVEPEDAEAMTLAENDNLNIAFNGYCAPYSSRQLLEYALSYDADPLSAGELRLMIEEKATGRALGIADLTEISRRDTHAFTGIYVFPDFRGQGYALEALGLLADFADAVLRISLLGAKIAEDNTASISLYEKAGYERKGTLEKWIYSPVMKDYVDMHIYQLRT